MERKFRGSCRDFSFGQYIIMYLAVSLSNSFSVGALSSVSNTLMHVVSKSYEGNKRSQETAPLLQDQNASPEAHVRAQVLDNDAIQPSPIFNSIGAGNCWLCSEIFLFLCVYYCFKS